MSERRIETIIEQLSKPSEAATGTVEGRMRLVVRCGDWLDSSPANKAREGGDIVQGQIPDLGRILLAV